MRKIVKVECVGRMNSIIVGKATLNQERLFGDPKEIIYDFYVDVHNVEKKSYGSYCRNLNTGDSDVDTQGLRNILIHLYENNLKTFVV